MYLFTERGEISYEEVVNNRAEKKELDRESNHRIAVRRGNTCIHVDPIRA
jgi:hypothetical protein